MRIECPACAATYEVPDGMLAVGQRVACARCGDDWTPLPALAVPGNAGPLAAAPVMAAPAAAAVTAASVGTAARLPASDFAIPAAPAPAPAPPGLPPTDTAPPQATPPSPPRPPTATDADRSPPSVEPARPDWFPRTDADWSLSDNRSPLVPLAWIGSVATLLALLGAGVAARDSLMAQWPPTSRLFSAIGLDDR